MRTRAITVACIVLAGIGIACSSGGDDTKGPGAQGEPAAAAGRTKSIVMEITGARKADVTYGLNADQSQDNDVKLPWKTTMSSSEPATIAVLLAQNKGTGTIKCKITMDGAVVKENSSSGEYATVTCSANDL